MVYLDSFRSLPEEDKKTILILFKDWLKVKRKQGKIIIHNLMNEKFLDKASMDQLLTNMAAYYRNFRKKTKTIASALSHLEQKFQKEYLDIKLLLQGKKIKSNPICLGTVVPVEKLKRHLQLTYSARFESAKQKKIKKILSNLSLYLTKAPYKNYFLKKEEYLIWFTWNKDEKNSDSFPFLKRGCSNEFRIGLGLSKDYRHRVLSFVFDTARLYGDGANIYRPTFCDARFYTGFRPSNKEEHGMTYPLVAERLAEFAHEGLFCRRPEGVEKSKNVKLGHSRIVKEHLP